MTRVATNLYPFIRSLLEQSFSGLFFSDASLWNQYKFIAFNILSCRTLIISYKILIIVVISSETKNELNICKIMSKSHNILTKRASFFISSAGKIESVREFKEFF